MSGSFVELNETEQTGNCSAQGGCTTSTIIWELKGRDAVDRETGATRRTVVRHALREEEAEGTKTGGSKQQRRIVRHRRHLPSKNKVLNRGLAPK